MLHGASATGASPGVGALGTRHRPSHRSCTDCAEAPGVGGETTTWTKSSGSLVHAATCSSTESACALRLPSLRSHGTGLQFFYPLPILWQLQLYFFGAFHVY